MSTIKLLQQHRSIRKFVNKPIPESIKQSILTCATRASTSGNIQPYSIIVTESTNHKAVLWDLHEKQDMILEAGMILTFCVDWSRMIRWCELSNTAPTFQNLLCMQVGMGDAFIAAQNAAIAAESEGLGICYMGTTLNNAEQLASFFNCPDHVFPVTSLVVGYPNETPEIRNRLPISAIVHDERYQSQSNNQLLDTYAEKEKAGWARYNTMMSALIKSSNVENLAQIYTELKYTKASNETASDRLKTLFESKGFDHLVS